MMQSKRQPNFKSPDVSKMQEVIIDYKTRIYIDANADPEEAKKRYRSHLATRR